MVQPPPEHPRKRGKSHHQKPPPRVTKNYHEIIALDVLGIACITLPHCGRYVELSNTAPDSPEPFAEIAEFKVSASVVYQHVNPPALSRH